MSFEEFQIWKQKEQAFILFFDGSSKGNPRVIGEGVVLYDPTQILLRLLHAD